MQVSSKRESNVSSLDSLSFFSASNSPFILLTISLSSSRIDSSVSSRHFFSTYINSTIWVASSSVFFISILSCSSLSLDSFRISSYSFGKSPWKYIFIIKAESIITSKQASKCSIFSYLSLDSLAISLLRLLTF